MVWHAATSAAQFGSVVVPAETAARRTSATSGVESRQRPAKLATFEI